MSNENERVAGPADLLWSDLLPKARPALMGILNVTPDSFSDGGRYNMPADALTHANRLFAASADVIDIGGESTRPGAQAVAVEDELARILPPVRALVREKRPISIDTRNAAVMDAALSEGAMIVNDVSALTHDARSLDIVRRHRCPVILMHMKGNTATMNDNPLYDDVVGEVAATLADHAARYIAAGLDPGRIALDPGLGFGKTHKHNLALLHNLERLVALGYPVCMGASRKLAAWTTDDSVKLGVSVTAAVIAAQKGAALLRVHDVAETRAALRVAGFDMPQN